MHQDHRVTAELVWQTFRGQPGSTTFVDGCRRQG
jgi:hypothetical protein